MIGILIFAYILCLVTLCNLTFMKGYILLGILGIFLPLLWFIGAIIPLKRGSRYERAEAERLQRAWFISQPPAPASPSPIAIPHRQPRGVGLHFVRSLYLFGLASWSRQSSRQFIW